jgi:hypothetical protein
VPKKKNSPKTTLNVEQIKKDSKKVGEQIRKANPELYGGEVDAGTSRRQSPLEQEMGSSKYKNMIHEHNDKNKHILDRLPFTFPKKRIVRSHRSDILIECSECGYESYGSEHTYMKTCGGCQQSTKVINPEAEKRGEDRDFTPGIFATASDILEMREKRRLAAEAKKKDQ